MLEAIEARWLPTTVVLLTGHASLETAVQAMKGGAYDYLAKPVDPQRLLLRIPKAIEAQRTRQALQTLRAPPDSTATGLNRMIGASPAMKEVFAFVQAVAQSTPSASRASSLPGSSSATGSGRGEAGFVRGASRVRAGVPRKALLTASAAAGTPSESGLDRARSCVLPY